MTISFKHEYRRHTLTSRCDVIGDDIIMKIILVDDLRTIFLYLLSNWGYIENCEIFKKFQNWWKFEVQANIHSFSFLITFYNFWKIYIALYRLFIFLTYIHKLDFTNFGNCDFEYDSVPCKTTFENNRNWPLYHSVALRRKDILISCVVRLGVLPVTPCRSNHTHIMMSL